MSPRIGSLFSGYGGLDMGVTAAIGGSVAWHVEFDKAPSKILAHHWPDVPNYGDVTKVDWSQVEPVDVITGGSPCQDLSHAGKRQGMTEGTRSNLWVAMREAIAQLRPDLVVWENVRGAYSAEADSELESDPRLLADTRRRDGEPVLRALGRVLGDLSDLGYDCRWHGLRAADVGAPHGRFRVFVVAHADHTGRGERRWPVAARAEHATIERRGEGALTLLPSPRATDGTKGGPNQRGSSGDLMLPSAVTLLPTPAVNDMGEGKTPEVDALLPTPNPFHAGNAESPEEWRARRLDVFKRTGTRHGPALNVVVWAAMEGKPLDPDHYMPDEEGDETCPTPASPVGTTSPHSKSALPVSGPLSTPVPSPEPSPNVSVGHRVTTTGSPNGSPSSTGSPDWGRYAGAIARWEVLTRPAPPPTQPSKKGTPQLSPAFSEWLMGLPEGHVTGVPGLSRNDQLKALGNGVVPQQCAAALRFLLSVRTAA